MQSAKKLTQEWGQFRQSNQSFLDVGALVGFGILSIIDFDINRILIFFVSVVIISTGLFQRVAASCYDLVA